MGDAEGEYAGAHVAGGSSETGTGRAGRGERTGLESQRCWLAVAAAWVAIFAILGVIKGPMFGLLGATYTAAVLIAALSPALGIWIALTAATYDRFFYLRNWEHQEWFPPQIHLVDPVTVILVIGFVVRMVQKRSCLQWKSWDKLYTVFFGFVLIAAIHGVLARYEAVMRVGRIVPALALYYPAREVVQRTAPTVVNRTMLA